MSYLSWKQVTKLDVTNTEIDDLYNQGFVATRLGRGVFDQTRSFRINLGTFSLSSENRRILKKTDGLEILVAPLPYEKYSWEIGKLGKDFYDTKFGVGTMSANKIREILTVKDSSSFTHLLTYSFQGKVVGYCIALITEHIIHYSYPFYELATPIENLGLGMMTRAIEWAKENKKTFIYLGSLQRPGDTYKLQFEGGEWYTGSAWSTNLEDAKNELTSLTK